MKTKYPEPVFIVQLNHSGELSETAFSRRISLWQRPNAGAWKKEALASL